MKFKNPLLFIFCIIAGYVIGIAVSQATQGVWFLHWLSLGTSIGINAGKPAYIDLAFIQIAFGFSMKLNVAEIICMVVGVLAGRKLR